MNIIALGAENKTNFSGLTKDGLYISAPINGLADIENFKNFEYGVRKYMGDNGIIPDRITCDSHPDYRSTRFAYKLLDENKNARLIRVQHHFAHIASCMLDNDIDEDAIGVSFDGTGFGNDGKSWGGEFLLCTRKDFSRVYHLKYVPQPGGDIASREGWRMAVAYLCQAFGKEFYRMKLPLFERIGNRKIDITRQMIIKDINSPLTSSAGRLFDAISSIIGICDVSNFEAEAAVLLEKNASKTGEGRYDYQIKSDEIDVSGMIRNIARDLNNGADRSVISRKFHNTLGEIIFSVCTKMSQSSGVTKVLVSGGCFQNKLLMDYVDKRFASSGLKLFKHKKYSTTDLGVSVGQAAIAASL